MKNGVRTMLLPSPHHSLREWSPPLPLTQEREVGRRPATAGFTLLEMLVALLIFGLISAVGVGVMTYAADNQEVLRQRMDRLGEFQRARALLAADLAQAVPRRVRQRNGDPSRNAFAGATDGAPAMRSGSLPLLAFVRRGWSNPDAEPRASLQHVEYRLVDGRLERSVRAALDGAAPGKPQRLLGGITAAHVGYHTRGHWNRGWSGGADALPDAVRLDLELEGIGRVEQMFLLPGVGR